MDDNQGTGNDNPKFTFAPPDRRKADVTDRERHQVAVAATVMPPESLDLTASGGGQKIHGQD